MNYFHEKAAKLIKSELNKAQIEITPKESGREGIDFNIKTKNGSTRTHEVYLQPINLDIERKVKIPKLALGEPNDSLWVALVLMMENEAINFYLIIHCFLLFLREFMNASYFLLKQ